MPWGRLIRLAFRRFRRGPFGGPVVFCFWLGPPCFLCLWLRHLICKAIHYNSTLQRFERNDKQDSQAYLRFAQGKTLKDRILGGFAFSAHNPKSRLP